MDAPRCGLHLGVMPFLRPLLPFLAWTLGLTWLLWSPFVLTDDPAWHHPALHVVGTWGPLLAAVVVAYRYRLRPGLLGFNHDWRWALTGAALPFGLLALAMVGIRFTAGRWPTLTGLAGSTEFASTPLPLYLLVCYLGYGLGEEVGWRGFLQPWLQRTLRPWATALWMTPFWAVWHLPLFAYQHSQFHTMDAAAALGWGSFPGICLCRC